MNLEAGDGLGLWADLILAWVLMEETGDMSLRSIHTNLILAFCATLKANSAMSRFTGPNRRTSIFLSILSHFQAETGWSCHIFVFCGCFVFFPMETGLSGEWGSDSVSILSYSSDITGIWMHLHHTSAICFAKYLPQIALTRSEFVSPEMSWNVRGLHDIMEQRLHMRFWSRWNLERSVNVVLNRNYRNELSRWSEHVRRTDEMMGTMAIFGRIQDTCFGLQRLMQS